MNKFEQPPVDGEEKDLKKEEEKKVDEITEDAITTDDEDKIDDVLEESAEKKKEEWIEEYIDIPEKNRKKGPMAKIENKVLTKESFEQLLDYWRSKVVGRLNAIYFNMEPVVKEEHIIEQYRSFKELYQTMGGGKMSHEILQRSGEDSKKMEAVAREIIQEAKSEVIREWEREFKLAESEEEKKEIREKIDKILFIYQ